MNKTVYKYCKNFLENLRICLRHYTLFSLAIHFKTIIGKYKTNKQARFTYQDSKSDVVITRDTEHRIRKPGHYSRDTLSLKKSLLIKETCTVSLTNDFCDNQ